MDAAYLQAALPKPFSVFGNRLKPFCLGHELLLQRFANKFSVESKETPGIFDLLTAVFICGHEYRPDFTLDRFSIPWRARWGARIFGKPYVKQAFKSFSAYIAEHTRAPEFYEIESGDGSRGGAPMVQSIKVALMQELGISELDALRMPFGLALWNFISMAEAKNLVRIVGERERQMMAAAATNEAGLMELKAKMFPKPESMEAAC